MFSEGRSSAGLYSLDFSVREDYRRCNRWNERLIKKGAEKYYEKTGISSYGSWEAATAV